MEVARTKLGIGLQKVESGHFKGFRARWNCDVQTLSSRLEKAVENLVISINLSYKVVQSSCEEDM